MASTITEMIPRIGAFLFFVRVPLRRFIAREPTKYLHRYR